MSYQDTIRYLESFTNYEKVPQWQYQGALKLERFRDFLSAIGNPQDSLSCIHVAGSKGKGSTCVFIANILRSAGFKVGLYTSPHLVDFRERIRILRPGTIVHSLSLDFEGMIAKNDLSKLVEQLKPEIERQSKNSQYGALSFFEVYTALAFVYFKKKQVDFLVLETGLGGRLDATNCVKSLVAAITPISYEHTDKLGKTLAAIAKEKAGIIKDRDISVVSAPQTQEALKVIMQRSKKIGAKLYTVGKEIKYVVSKYGTFSVFVRSSKYANLKVRLRGRHQIINASLAVAAIAGLQDSGIDINTTSIRKGLYNTLWPGRCEVVGKNPLVVLDGAQNVSSARALKVTLAESFKYRRLVLILGISSDKDIQGICNEFLDYADEIILTMADTPRAASSEDLAVFFKHQKVYLTNRVRDAYIKALKLADKNDLVLVTGSLFVVGEFRGIISTN